MKNKSLTEMRQAYPDVNSAFWYAVRAHRGQFRKDMKTPYIQHPVEVAEIVCTMTSVPSVVEAALLHDTVEDTQVRINDIARLFGAYVADLVSDETENKRRNQDAAETWRLRKEESIRKIAGAGAEAKMISLGDKLSNLRAIKRALSEVGDEVWTWFHNPNVSDQAWYYRSMRDQYIGLKSTDAWKEYSQLIEEIYGASAANVQTYKVVEEELSEEEEEELLEEPEESAIDETPLDISSLEDEEM